MNTEVIVGIDLGTTNSEIAVVKNGKIHLITLDGSKIVPSVVSITPTGQILVGNLAVNNELAAPLDTIRKIKRRMGEEETWLLQDKSYSPEMISSLILKRLKLAAEELLGISVHKAVITVPAFFNEKQREATQRAAELAGLEPVRLLNEPTAAALAYSLEKKQEGYSLVYDLGGGTFDVSIVKLSEEFMEVKASHGDTQLGGSDFDQMIAEQARQSFQTQYGLDLSADPVAWVRVMRAAEAAKIRLSEEASAQMSEEFIATKDNVPLHLQFKISRTQFEDMIRPSIERSLVSVRKALEMAAMTAKSLEKVILVGGATYTPLVAQMLEAELNIVPQAWLDPSTVVAMGAAVEAAQLAGQSIGPRMIDITPHSLSIACLNDSGHLYPSVLIRRNTPLPCSGSRVFYKQVQGQQAIRVHAYQGESSQLEENRSLGSFMLEDLEDSSDMDVHIKFQLDRSGLLHVTATDISSGKQAGRTLKKVTASRKKQANISDLQSIRIHVEEQVQLEELELWASGGDTLETDLAESYQDLMDRVSELLEGMTLTPEDREELVAALNTLKFSNNDSVAAKKLSELLYFLL